MMKETLIDDTHKEETETRKIEDIIDDIKTTIEILKMLQIGDLSHEV